MTRSTILAAILGPVLEAASPSATSNEPIVVAPVQARGDLHEAVGERLDASLREALQKSDLRILKVSEKISQRAATCTDANCRATVIAKVEAKFLLSPEITLVDKDYHMRLTLYGANGASVAQLEETCSLCGQVEAAELMADLGARMGRKVDLATRTALVEIRSEPAGAKVYIGGDLVGTTPLEVPVDAGVHPLRIEMPGRIGLRRKIAVVAGEATSLDFAAATAPAQVGAPTASCSRVWAGLDSRSASAESSVVRP